jgi:hypothetical protein
MSAPDESWPMIEQAVFRTFDDLAAQNPGEHVAIGPRLEELGWSDIEAEYPIAAAELLFRAQGRSLAHTDCLTKVMLAELTPRLDGPVDGLVLPAIADGYAPSSDGDSVAGILLGPLPREGRLVVPVSAADGTVSIAIVEVNQLGGERLDTFDPSAHWTQVSGPVTGERVGAATEWDRAVVAAHRVLATELVALADQALRIAVDQVSARIQFGSPIGSFQSPRHLLADASAGLEGARALVDQSWRAASISQDASLPPPDAQLLALTAKAAAGRAHRAVSDAAIQVCGAIGLTIEHNLHRYVTRGFQIDALCGSYQRLEASLAHRLFTDHSPDDALPALVALG